MDPSIVGARRLRAAAARLDEKASLNTEGEQNQGNH